MTLTLFARRAVASVLGAGSVFLGVAAPASADVAPGCTVADFTNVETGVAAAMTAYLFSHPDVNNFLSGLQGQKKDAVLAQTRAYLQANPQVKTELGVIRAPVVDMRNRCNIPNESALLGVL